MINFYAINLKRDEKRRESLERQFEKSGEIAKLNIIEAIDAKTSETVEEIYNNKQDEIIVRNITMMSQGEIACFLSHQKALRAFLETNETHAIIVEDDIFLGDEFWQNLPEIFNWCKKHEACFLNFLPAGRRFKNGNVTKLHYKIERLSNFSVVQPFLFPAGAVCYLVSRSVAELLLAQKPFVNYDDAFRCLIVKDCSYFVLLKTIVGLAPFESTIDTSTNFQRSSKKSLTISKIGKFQYIFRKTVNRLKYRFALHCYNMKKFGFFKTLYMIIMGIFIKN